MLKCFYGWKQLLCIKKNEKLGIILRRQTLDNQLFMIFLPFVTKNTCSKEVSLFRTVHDFLLCVHSKNKKRILLGYLDLAECQNLYFNRSQKSTSTVSFHLHTHAIKEHVSSEFELRVNFSQTNWGLKCRLHNYFVSKEAQNFRITFCVDLYHQ